MEKKHSGDIRCHAHVHFNTPAERPAVLLDAFLDNQHQAGIAAVVHRVVHGGDRLRASTVITPDIESGIDTASVMAPLHNPVALTWIAAARDLFGKDIPQIAAFDTAFYTDMPDTASTYALPQRLRTAHHVRRYGFHGLAHRGMWERWHDISGMASTGSVISIQLGSGCSITAIDRGKAIDTSMGFSPLEGLMMSTRCGDIDPGLLIYLQRYAGFDLDQIEHMLSHESGLAGISGSSGDMRVLLEEGSAEAELAIEMFCYRAIKYIGAYWTILGGADALLFGGGIGAHSPPIRQRITQGLSVLGLELDSRANAQGEADSCISSTDSSTGIWVIADQEQRIMAEEAVSLLAQGAIS
ncbi:MAG TPA: acetate/propionate family kinase [Mariprofundaceae bacterium]|nr:acetate/propionate family kinase [Mariprofundaceae bacterium]